MRGKKGVIDTTRLVRSKPFGEWVTVYYRPDDVDDDQLLEWIRANRCPRAALVRKKDGVQNPFVAAGDVVRVKIKGSVTSSKLPKGWTLKEQGSSSGAVLVQVPILVLYIVLVTSYPSLPTILGYRARAARGATVPSPRT